MGGSIKRLLSLLLRGAVAGQWRAEGQEQDAATATETAASERGQVRRALARMRGAQQRGSELQEASEGDRHWQHGRTQSPPQGPVHGKNAELWSHFPVPKLRRHRRHRSTAAAAAAAAVVHRTTDRWAPACHPRSVDAEHITNLFRDDNPNACSLM
ncbi:hypothetical protein GUJ93_ZPchr0006g41923 [Zizania palustris]|uniref:Uncharacterized protein n=1 Tax=Zizania palustris TaxID=103762 RepID=A0A8J5T1Z9_ZIZPA|nr:hypothetical protein GUJ93_ZPchr0006g41923 [Zizania palustris]